jgi:hypothetical protein
LLDVQTQEPTRSKNRETPEEIAEMFTMKAKMTALVVVAFLAVCLGATSLFAAQNTCPGCSEPAKVVHPNGFGSESYARWKANVGLKDSGGNVNFAMYMQHMTPPTEAATGKAVVAIEGFDGSAVGIAPGVTSLAFYVRTLGPAPFFAPTGECTATSPRFSVRWRIPGSGTPDQFYDTTGCSAMTSGPTLVAPNGFTYQQRICDAFTCLPPTPGAIIVSISIQFDDLVQHFSHIDNISVTAGPGTGTTYTWTRPADNGAN